MCGIAGIYNFRSQAPVSQATLEHQTRVLIHRGPDAEGFYTDGPLGLGHRRLSILDLSDRGRQPMASPDGRYVLTYNGEIYNYLELRHELETKGYRFQTDTDTEVVLTLYAKEGRACLSRLNGMYAFAVWDSQDKQLFVARDRIGIKDRSINKCRMIREGAIIPFGQQRVKDDFQVVLHVGCRIAARFIQTPHHVHRRS